LLALEKRAAMVPAIWASEITNALLVGERRNRLGRPEVRRFVELLKGLEIVQDVQTVTDTMNDVFPLAQEYRLTAYDAAYLDVAVRRQIPLATLDSDLRKAALAADIETFNA
jgi:predicted nucleic acid-binding protein